MFFKILKWGGLTILVLFVALVIYRAFVLEAEDRTEKQIAKIHATKLTIADVMGESLPPDPGESADDTVQGIDANTNGIRDDVELAIFKEYPNSAKTRAVLLQYALALQMEVTQSFVNEAVAVAVAQMGDKASKCIGTSFPRDDYEEFIKVTDSYVEFLERSQLNTEERIAAQKEFYKGNLNSYSSLDEICDVYLLTLPN